MKAQLDCNGYILPEFAHYSLRKLMAGCTDFINEPTAMGQLLQTISDNNHTNISLPISPKYHCEIAGEGVEYAWGLSKLAYLQVHVKEKRTKKKFDETVRKCIENIKQRDIQVCAARARRYMITYSYLQQTQEQQPNTQQKINYIQIENMVKDSKVHHRMVDQERGFLNEVWKCKVEKTNC